MMSPLLFLIMVICVIIFSLINLERDLSVLLIFSKNQHLFIYFLCCFSSFSFVDFCCHLYYFFFLPLTLGLAPLLFLDFGGGTCGHWFETFFLFSYKHYIYHRFPSKHCISLKFWYVVFSFTSKYFLISFDTSFRPLGYLEIYLISKCVEILLLSLQIIDF